MSKIANYLGNHLHGEVITDVSVRHQLARDGSVLRITPLLAIYPFNTSDIRKIAHFAWQLAEKGHVLPLIPRGNGGNKVGAAIGSGAIIASPPHLNTILEVDTKQKLVRLQPGVSLETLQETMKTHGLVWPVSGDPKTTIGAAIADNLYGEKGGKYGSAISWTDQLEVVLANGDVIQTGRLSKRELNKKKGLAGFEGEIYRELDGLISDHQEAIESLSAKPGTTGYALAHVKDRKGNFDLTPLIAGSQGTLGIISEVILRLDHYHPRTEVIVASVASIDDLEQLIPLVNKFQPSRFEFINSDGLALAETKYDITLSDLLPEDTYAADIAGIVAIELEDTGRTRSKAKKLVKSLEKNKSTVRRSDGDFEHAEELWQMFRRVQTVLSIAESDHKSPIPVIEDTLVPLEDIDNFFIDLKALAKKHRLQVVSWAHLGTGIVHTYPFLNLRNLSDKQKLAKLLDEYYALVEKYRGSVAGEYGEGRLRAHQGVKQFSSEERELFLAVKKIFDAHGIFNPGVKLPNEKDVLAHLNEHYDSSQVV